MRLGEDDRTRYDSRSDHRVQEILLHEDFRPPVNYNDIALVKLADRASMSNKIGPICMPTDIDRMFTVNHIATVLGWGSLRFGEYAL